MNWRNGLSDLRQQLEKGNVCHGEYNQHNVLMLGKRGLQ